MILVATLSLGGCWLLLYAGIIVGTTQWSVSGQLADFDAAEPLLKLAAFYRDAGLSEPLDPGDELVSNVERVSALYSYGVDIDIGGDRIPADGDLVQLFFWLDSDDDDAFDAGEEARYAVPASGDLAFHSQPYAAFTYLWAGLNDTGWYVVPDPELDTSVRKDTHFYGTVLDWTDSPVDARER